ncbi:hypothetical protein jhhlp_002765 [Lomentospora prolificans]|uniref:Enoyl reductase (ER) domain-containing protein n=1 Tax=Lomentospora prolificans TaxID=41688 RepID=A0A2N3NEU5_9PEZI|nr:hypothetical protein jhhlp_002765 [Lomentospora prolificans]
MPHIAAIIPEAKAPFEFKQVDTSQPGPRELLIKNELISLLPINAKVAKAAILPVPYPAILGNSYGGTVVAVGSEVTNFQVGDRVAAAKGATPNDNKYGVFQEYVVSRDDTAGKITGESEFNAAVNLIGNLATVVSIVNVTLGLDRPEPTRKVPAKGKKILVYGGTSSFGSLAVQYLTQAGYDVVTTTSPKHKDFVAKLGAIKIIDHTEGHDVVLKSLVEQGPYDSVIDSISLPDTVQITAGVLTAQGGGTVLALLPAFGPETLPEGVTRDYRSWSFALAEEKNQELLRWTYNTYLPQAVAEGRTIPLATKEFSGGLRGLPDAIDFLFKGVSATKVVVKFDK